MREDFSKSYKFKYEYSVGIDAMIEHRRAECDRIRAETASPEKIAQNREKYRADFISLLGWPLTEYESLKNTPLTVSKEFRCENDDYIAYSMQFEILAGLPFYGIYFETKHESKDHPFVICQHGGGGCPEYCAGFYGDSIYNGMVERAARRGANVFAPGLLIWDRSEDSGNPAFDRAKIDNDLCHVGGSIQALEVFHIRRVLDYFIECGIAREGRIGMIGLSYGGLYTLVTSAVDTRISAAYSSCYLNDRYKYLWPDWTWKGAALKFLDAEIASLIAPRPLFLEAGWRDHLFGQSSFAREAERAAVFYDAADAKDKINYRVFDGGHELSCDEVGFDFIFNFLIRE